LSPVPDAAIATRPANEAERLAALTHLEILDSLPQQAFDDITALASALCGTPIARISLVDADRVWFKSRVGFAYSQVGREGAFCAHAILDPDRVMVVEDARLDARFAGNPLVTQSPAVRFYAGAPVVTAGGLALGTVCAIDTVPRSLNPTQLAAMQALARLVVNLIEREQHLREEARSASELAQRRNQYLVAVATEALDLKAFVDRDYVYRYVNQIYLDYWQLGRGAVEGRPITEIMDAETFGDLVKPHLDAALAGQVVCFEATLNFPLRGTTHVELTYLPARDATGTIIGAVVRVHDIQKLKEREQVLRSTVALLESKALSQQKFIHMVSHDLREPLNSIVNFSSVLADELGPDLSAQARRYLDFVRSGGERMKLLLDDLIGFVRLEIHAIEPRPVDMTRITQLVRDDLALAISRTGGRVECGSLPVVQGDESLLRIVVQNLVANGLKFVRPGTAPVVRISCSSNQLWHEISVRDEGIGIPLSQLENIFDMFKRLNSRKEYDGTGLGLSICRRIAELHAGRISATSAPGLGSCFSLYLPVMQPHQTTAPAHALH